MMNTATTTATKTSSKKMNVVLLLLVVMLGVASSFTTVPVVASPRSGGALYLSDEPEAAAASEEPATPPPKPVKCPNCDQCDGSGRIEGGIGTVLTWWPIKAYRPCPNFIDKGGFYQRSGQGLDEIAFGRDSTFDSGK